MVNNHYESAIAAFTLQSFHLAQENMTEHSPGNTHLKDVYNTYISQNIRTPNDDMTIW